MSEESTDEQEQREAEALARALERGSATEELPEEVLQTAALLRHSAGGSELPADREEFVLAEVLEAAERVNERRSKEAPEASRASSLWRWLFGFAGATAAAALLIFLIGRDVPAAVPAELPEPNAALLSSGLARLAGGAEGEDAAYEDSFSDYRGAVYSAIGQRYR